jgi:hypothetical protein
MPKAGHRTKRERGQTRTPLSAGLGAAPREKREPGDKTRSYRRPSREPMLSSTCWRLPCPLPGFSRFAQRVFSVAVPEDIFLQVELGVLKPRGACASVPPARSHDCCVSSGNLERFTIPPSAAGLGTRLDRAGRERQPGALSETYVEGSGILQAR